MKRKDLQLTAIILIISVLNNYPLQAQQVTINVTTVTYRGTYAPSHCFAMWITNSSGAYVNTINRQSNKYTTYLTNWKNNAGWSTTNKAHEADGVTGATLTSHNYAYASSGQTLKRIPFTWNCRDYNGNLVPDGTYTVNVEFTEKNTTGVLAKYTFTKGSASQTTSYTNLSSFTGASIVYTAPTAIVGTSEPETDLWTDGTTLHIKNNQSAHPNILLAVHHITGKIVLQQRLTQAETSVSLASLPEGCYLVSLSDHKGRILTRKIQKK